MAENDGLEDLLSLIDASDADPRNAARTKAYSIEQLRDMGRSDEEIAELLAIDVRFVRSAP